MSQQIDSLRKVILQIQEQIERQPTLEGIQTEIVETRYIASPQEYIASPQKKTNVERSH
ncbi:hypothetical protein [Calothrix sp. NIES-3974]|uniref:hypothetical protein n=1 Tax=Calothrix sp. NIES-3974 TaxID=2005462 RepID=UPI000B5DF025|nr:hypothetical protein [Calothrix sp. NIES-3974]BAZ08011.1 pentapeptide repeat protein [Calothrix sp. NIES-3974]